MKQRHIIILSVFLELLILAAVVGTGLIARKANAAIELPDASEWHSDYIEAADGVWSVTDGGLTESDRLEGDLPANTVTTSLEDATRFSLTLIESPYFSLGAGSYTLTVSYAATVNQYAALRMPAGSATSAILANPATLSRNRNVLEYHFFVKADTEAVSIAIPYNYYGNFSINSVSLAPNMDSTKSRAVTLLFIFALLDLIIFDLAGERRLLEHLPAVCGVAVIAVAASLPLILRGVVIGQDEYFHLMRIEGVAEALKSGQFPVRMQGAWMDGFGYPVSVYYGDILLYLPAALRIVGFSVNAAYKIYIFAVNLATALITYLCTRAIFKREHIALICSAGYTLASYRLVDVYGRSAVGEAAAFIFFPIIALALWRMYAGDGTLSEKNDAGYRRVGAYAAAGNENARAVRDCVMDAVLLAVGMSGLLFTHTLSVAMTAAVLAIAALILFKRTFKLRTLMTWLIGIVGTLLLAAVFLIPFLDYTLNVTTNSAVNEGAELIQWGGAFWYQYFLVFMNPFGFNSTELSERMSYSPGLILMVAFVAAIVHICLRHAKRPTVYVFVLSVITLWLASDLFPYDFISEHITDAVAAIQFPWRFVGLACVCLTLLLGCLLATIEEHAAARGIEERANRGITAIFGCMAAVMAIVFFAQYAANDYQGYFIDTAELDPYAVTSFFLRDGIADDEPLSMEYPQSEDIAAFEILGRSDTSLSAYAEAGENGYLELPVFYYPYYHVTDESGAERALTDGSHHLIGVDLAGGYSGNIRLYFAEPLLWRVSEIISLVTAIGMIIFAVRSRYSDES